MYPNIEMQPKEAKQIPLPGYPPDLANPPGYSPNPTNPPGGQSSDSPNVVPGSNNKPPPYSYGSPNQPPVVLTNQPTNVTVPPQPSCPNHMYCSVAMLLCCNPILGILAVIFSSMTRFSLRRGDLAAASCFSRTALYLNIAAFVLGILTYIAIIIFVIYVRVKYA